MKLRNVLTFSFPANLINEILVFSGPTFSLSMIPAASSFSLLKVSSTLPEASISIITSAKHPGLNLAKLLASNSGVERRDCGVVGVRLGFGVGKVSNFWTLVVVEDLSETVVEDAVVVLGTNVDFNSIFLTVEDGVGGSTVVDFLLELTILSSKFPISLSLLLSVAISLAKNESPC